MCILQPGSKVTTPQIPSEPPIEAPATPELLAGTTTAASGTTTTTPTITTTGPLTGEPFKPEPCQECYCGPVTNPITKLHVITCKPIVCQTNCSEVSSFKGHINTHTHTYTSGIHSHTEPTFCGTVPAVSSCTGLFSTGLMYLNVVDQT